MNARKIAGNIIVHGISLAIGAYIGYLAGPVMVYYIKRSEIERTQVNLLKTEIYNAVVNGKEKRLTLAGEIHIYNRQESEIARQLVESHSNFAGEGSGISLNFFDRSLAVLSRFPPFYLMLGTGRTYDGIHEIAKNEGYEVEDLEKGLELKLSPHLSLLKDGIFSVLTAPNFFRDARFYEALWAAPENLFPNSQFKKELVDDRDRKMAGKIVEILQRGNIDDLLVVVGRGHLQGIKRELSDEIELRDVN